MLITLVILKITKNNETLQVQINKPMKVETEKVFLKDLKPEFIFYGNIKGLNQIDIIAKLSGKIVKVSPKVFLSNQFYKGEIIFEIDNFEYKQILIEKRTILEDYQNELSSSYLIYEEAKKQLEIKKKDYDRKLKLYGDIITKKELEKSQLSYSVAKTKTLDEQAKIKSLESNIEIAKTQLKVASRNLNDTKYKAPFDGKVSNSFIEVGMVLSTGKSLGRFINTNSLNVEFFVGENTYTKLGDYQKNLINISWARSGYKNNYKGKIFYVDSAIDKDRSGLIMKATLEKIDPKDPIKPGVFVEVKIKGETIKKSFLIDENSIYENSYIFVLENGIPKKRNIAMMGVLNNKIIIKGDIQPNEEIIITRLNNINLVNKLISESTNEK